MKFLIQFMPLYQYPLFITIIIANLLIWPTTSKLQKDTIIQPSVESLLAAPTTKKNEAYNQYMQDGYSATQNRDYKKALEHFTKALKENPNDDYAKQAIKNVKRSQLRSNSPSNSLFFTYIVGGLLTIGVGLIAIPLLLKSKRFTKKEKKYQPNSLLASEEDLIDIKAITSEEQPTSDLELQQTTRIPNIDLIENLINDLQDLDPKKRRKAIWEIAQKGDSRALKPLVHQMIEADSIERGLILESLAQISVRTLKPINQALAIALQDQSSQVRKNAVRDLTRIYSIMSQVNQLITVALEDPDPEVQETAKWAVKQLNIQPSHRLDLSSSTEDNKDLNIIP